MSEDQDIFITSVKGVSGRWPGTPARWSYSALKEFESCPRRYSLKRASYDSFWDRKGYPEYPRLHSLVGDVIHGCIEVILRSLAAIDPAITEGPPMVSVLRSLGGYSELISREIEKRTLQLRANPRAAPVALVFKARLQEEIPKIRERVQMLVSRIPAMDPLHGAFKSGHVSHARGPLGIGAHPEAKLIADGMRFWGRPDLVIVRNTGGSIVDFKSGAISDQHLDQLRIYALLWRLDSTANPKGLPVESLSISYVGHDVRVQPPSDHELVDLRSLLAERIDAADDAVRRRPPKAIPSEHCQWCSVRHMCDEYWRSAQYSPPTRSGFGDVEVTVLKQNGPLSWEVELRSGGLRTILRTLSESQSFTVGDRLRLLGLLMSEEKEAQLLVLSLTRYSEVFLLEQSWNAG